ncbi:hypothetical protein [uncultured Bacteroides sp.]|uniref:hypothetical protein n=1 Tax=uncultured Bacteroides sp. TaxID=162156 RepID=UPI002625DD30|nr:hypothetical protein [uncultured Bacteroides sp.]
MSELISKIWNFFENRRISIPRKISITILIILSILFVDNIVGFSYLYINSQELDYLLKIEKTKVAFNQDTITCKLLDEMKYDFINRRTVVEQFLELFDSRSALKVKASHNNMQQESDSENIQRNQILHTVSSSLFWIIWLIIFLFMLIISPFAPPDNKWGLILGMVIGVSGMSILIWVTQWLFGLVPIFFNRPWINYTLQFILNLIPIFILTIGTIKNKLIT